MIKIVPVVAALSLAVSAAAQSPPVLFQTPMSPRNANYTIEASLDAKAHVVKASEKIRWRNIQGIEAKDAYFHLYYNAFANNRSVFITESGGQLRGDQFDRKHWGYCRVTSIAQVVDGKPVPLKQEFPGDDRTVMKVDLAAPVPPGGEAEFEVTFEDQLPKVFARAGFAGDFNMVGQWFPKLGVWQGEKGWNCHPYHANSEFFSDFGVYDVTVTVPKNYVVGSTGVQWDEQVKGDTKTLKLHAEDVHDFGWTASPHFVDKTETYDGVKIRVLMQPMNASQIPRYMEAAKKTIELYAKWIWKYPYPQMTIVDPPADGMGAAGMEYPMLITGGTSPIMPAKMGFPEMVVVHEFGHNYWYGMEANNEFEEAWLDEGINSYYETRIMDEWLGKDDSMVGGFAGWHLGDVSQQRVSYISVPDMDPMVLESWKYASNGTYGAMSYGKSAIVLSTLEGILGREKMDAVMRAFFMEVKFTHPTTADFLRIVSREAGRDMDPVLKPLLYGTGTVDFKVARVKSLSREEVEGYDLTADPPKLAGNDQASKGKGKGADKADKPKADAKDTKADTKADTKGKKSDRVFDSKVIIQRKGELVLPVEVLVTFKDGTTKLEKWDGVGRYVTYKYEGPEVVKVVVDPDGKIPVDLNILNNGWASKADGLPARALTTRFRVVAQGLMVLIANLL
jgi:hypothetical protein